MQINSGNLDYLRLPGFWKLPWDWTEAFKKTEGGEERNNYLVLRKGGGDIVRISFCRKEWSFLA